jgi:hypothetical protein
MKRTLRLKPHPREPERHQRAGENLATRHVAVILTVFHVYSANGIFSNAFE